MCNNGFAISMLSLTIRKVKNGRATNFTIFAPLYIEINWRKSDFIAVSFTFNLIADSGGKCVAWGYHPLLAMAIGDLLHEESNMQMQCCSCEYIDLPRLHTFGGYGGFLWIFDHVVTIFFLEWLMYLNMKCQLYSLWNTVIFFSYTSLRYRDIEVIIPVFSGLCLIWCTNFLFLSFLF